MLGSVLVCAFCKVSAIRVLACIFSTAITFFDRIKENIKYGEQSKKIHDRIESLEISKDKAQIKGLQELIEERRKIRVVGINFLHKKSRQTMSDQDIRIE